VFSTVFIQAEKRESGETPEQTRCCEARIWDTLLIEM